MKSPSTRLELTCCCYHELHRTVIQDATACVVCSKGMKEQRLNCIAEKLTCRIPQTTRNITACAVACTAGLVCAFLVCCCCTPLTFECGYKETRRKQAQCKEGTTAGNPPDMTFFLTMCVTKRRTEAKHYLMTTVKNPAMSTVPCLNHVLS